MSGAFAVSDVRRVERQAIACMLAENPDLYAFSPVFVRYISQFYPEWQTERGDTKIIQVSQMCEDDPTYYWEEIGSWLWRRWNKTRSQEDSDAFVTYLFPVIEGCIFRSGQHMKSKLTFEELFQELVIVVLTKMPKYDPARVVRFDKAGAEVFTKTFSYFNNALFWALITITTTHAAKNPDMVLVDDEHTGAADEMTALMTDFHMELRDLSSNTAFDTTTGQIAAEIENLVSTNAGMVEFIVRPISAVQSAALVPKESVLAFYGNHRRLMFGFRDRLSDNNRTNRPNKRIPDGCRA